MYRGFKPLVTLLLVWPVSLLAADSTQTSSAEAVEYGERLDATAFGPGVVESMDVALARDRAAAERPTADESQNHRGQWVVPSGRSTYYPYSGRHNLTNKWGDTAMGIGFGGPVDVAGAYFAGQGGPGVWTTGVRVIGYREGAEVGRTEWFSEISDTPAWLAMNLHGVDRIVIESKPVLNNGGWYALDDLTFTRSSGSGLNEPRKVVLDFEDCQHRTVLSGTDYAGLTWERGTGSAHDGDSIPAPQVAIAPEFADDGVEAVAGPLLRAGSVTPPELLLNFQGVVRGDAGQWSYPPDTCGAIGPDHFLVTVNRVFAVFDKHTGAELMSISLGSFLPGSSGDPRVLFDQFSNRWVVIVSDFSSRTYLAVSLTDDPTGAWFKTNFVVSQGEDAGCWPDYPTLGVNSEGIFSATYMVGCGMTIFVIDKAPLIDDPPSMGTVTAFRGLPMEGAIQPVHTYGEPYQQFFVSRFTPELLRVRRVGGDMTAPAMQLLGTVAIPDHDSPPDVPALGSSTPLDSVGSRLMNAVYRNGSIWTAHTIGYQGKAACRWYEIDVEPLVLLQQGTVSDPSLHYFFPAIAVNTRGDAALGFSGANSNQYAAAYCTGRLATNTAGRMAEPLLLREGSAPQNNIDGYGRNRWGDYSLTSVDPDDDLTLWTIQEYAHATDDWGTWIGRLEFPVDCNDNGVADSEDIAAGTSQDCNNDDRPDECETGSAVTQDFEGTGGSSFQLNGSAEALSGAVRLTPASANQHGSVVFTRRPLEPVASFTAAFDFRIGGGSGADGFSFAMLDVTSYTRSAVFGESGPGEHSLAVQFDTYANAGENDNHLDLLLDGVSLGTYNPTFDLNNDQWHSVWIEFEDQAITVELTPNGGSPETAYDAVPVTGYVPFKGLFGLGARTGGANDEHWVDEVVVTAVSLTDCNTNANLDECDLDAGSSADCNTNRLPDECDLADGVSADCNSNSIPDECDEDCNGNDSPDDCDIAAGTSFDGNGNGVPDECEAVVVFVDADAPGPNFGISWEYAFADLQDALAMARTGGVVAEIWVTAGVYTPDRGTGYREASFELAEGVALYGGFSGEEENREQRDPAANLTVLSGDLAGNDPTGGTGENSYNVILASGTGGDTVLDGFVITGGNANGSGTPYNAGAGIYAEAGSPRIVGCRIVGNSALFGGGIYSAGGGPSLVNCAFSGNAADFGGAIFNDGGNVTVTNCTMGGNTGTVGPGGLYGSSSSQTTMTNTVLWGNSVAEDQAQFAQVYGGSLTVNYCCVQGLTGTLGGTGNIGAAPEHDPLYADLDGPDDALGTADDDLRLSAGTRCIDAGDKQVDTDASTPGIEPLPLTDLSGNPRVADDPATTDVGPGAPPIVDMGAHELPAQIGDGDLDDDGDVDLVDFEAWQGCMTGPGAAPYPAGCGAFDFDGDSDIDLDDFAAFQAVFTASTP